MEAIKNEEEKAICGVCKKPMPEGEEMFQYHGYSGPCPVDEKKPEPYSPHTKGAHSDTFGGAGDSDPCECDRLK